MLPAPDTAPWWQQAVVYQIYPRSFADSTGSGVGDLTGILTRLDYLQWLGVDAIWISPFFPSPMHDFGYDVADYCSVDPIFGSLADFDALLAAAHARDLRVLIDWVPAHTSIEHPWFIDARSSRDNPKRDWYVWRDPGPDGAMPNNWTCAFRPGAPAWSLDPATQQLYLHSFLAEQPDLNWSNPEVEAAMHDVLRFWLDRGVDGFRADVIHNIGKDPGLASVDDAVARIPHTALNHEPVTHDYLRRIRALVDSYPGCRMMVGEVWLLHGEQIASYYGSGDELHLCFNFPALFAAWEEATWRDCIEKTRSLLDPRGAWPSWVLSNHDVPRHRSRYASAARARAAAVLLLTQRGTPFLYMGEELGLEDAIIPPARAVDPGSRDGCRAPMPWDATPQHGWSADPWLPWPPDADRHNLASERDDPASMLHLYRRLLAARRQSPALCLGDFEFVDAPAGLLAYQRRHGADRRVVVVNFTDRSLHFDPDPQLRIEVASDEIDPGETFTGSVAASQALILRPH